MMWLGIVGRPTCERTTNLLRRGDPGVVAYRDPHLHHLPSRTKSVPQRSHLDWGEESPHSAEAS